jgi:hypothetical protein
MAVDHPRATAGTGRAQSLELIFAELDRGASPKSSRPIKRLSSGLHDADRPAFFTNVRHPRSHHFSQRYTMWLVDKRGNLRDTDVRFDLERRVTSLLGEHLPESK